ncbi:tyrosine-type recombinase/integrase [Acidovorax soli]|uniref:Site-specific recombinase XerC n=1 Tax=Acidovorax soli TaxID=592050 RepID=A0A1H4B627_9BURK|nr:site-specific integrase [Acidovorax soli]SEA43526.1 Site-specific recombinase XerC [Acidovorax soli]
MGARETKGSIAARPRKDGTVSYQATFKIKGGRAIVKSFDDPEDARIFLESIATDMAAQNEARERKARQEMLAKAHKSPESRQSELLDTPIKIALAGYEESGLASPTNKFAIPAIAKQAKSSSIREIKKSWIANYIAGMRATASYTGKPYAYATIVRQMGVLKAAIEWQAEELETEPPKFPFSRRLFPKNWEGKRERRLEPHEETALIGKLRELSTPSRHHWRLLVKLALETGARLQELVGIQWKEIDFKACCWTIPETREKTGKRRTVPLTPAAMRAVSILRLMAVPANPRAFHLLGDPSSVSNLFRRYSRAAGLVEFKFHDLRHEAISRMVCRSPDIYAIMKIVGHSSPEMLERYANLRAEELAKALRSQDPNRRDRR